MDRNASARLILEASTGMHGAIAEALAAEWAAMAERHASAKAAAEAVIEPAAWVKQGVLEIVKATGHLDGVELHREDFPGAYFVPLYATPQAADADKRDAVTLQRAIGAALIARVREVYESEPIALDALNYMEALIQHPDANLVADMRHS